MKNEEIKKVIETIQGSPIDDFWSEEGNPDLFYDIVQMLNRKGLDLKLIVKEDK